MGRRLIPLVKPPEKLDNPEEHHDKDGCYWSKEQGFVHGVKAPPQTAGMPELQNENKLLP